MKKESILFSSIFAASLGLAWWAALPTTTKDPERKAVVSIAPAQVASLQYQSPDWKAEAVNKGSDRWWITTEKAGVKEGFLASVKMKDLLNQLNPLEAMRVVGVVKDDGLAEYGLNGATKNIRVIDAKGNVLLALNIGKQAYGSRNVFVQDTATKSVLLIAGDFITDLEKADLKLYERTMMNIQLDDVQSASILSGTKSKTFAHTRRDDKGALIWTVSTPEGVASASAKSWFDRLDRVRLISFAKDEETAMLKDAKPIMEVDLQTSNTKEHLVFVKTAHGTNGGNSGPDYWVYSQFLGAWAKVASARLEPLEKDLPTITAD